MRWMTWRAPCAAGPGPGRTAQGDHHGAAARSAASLAPYSAFHPPAMPAARSASTEGAPQRFSKSPLHSELVLASSWKRCGRRGGEEKRRKFVTGEKARAERRGPRTQVVL